MKEKISQNYCSNCGTKIEDRAGFCQNCGTKIEDAGKSVKKKTSDIADHESSDILENVLFYGEDWIRSKYFVISSLPHFDILVTKDNFYLIQLPKTHDGTLGLILGLVLFNILGAIAGTLVGNSSDKSKRKKCRDTWLNSNHKLISRKYENNVFLKIPKDKLKNFLLFKKNKFIVITNSEKTITLKKNENEYEQFSKFIESYVL